MQQLCPCQISFSLVAKPKTTASLKTKQANQYNPEPVTYWPSSQPISPLFNFTLSPYLFLVLLSCRFTRHVPPKLFIHFMFPPCPSKPPRFHNIKVQGDLSKSSDPDTIWYNLMEGKWPVWRWRLEDKWSGRVWTRLIWYMIGTGGILLWTR